MNRTDSTDSNPSDGRIRHVPDFPAYRGSDPYLFVSYTSTDDVVVHEELGRLYEIGVRFWYYVAGIQGGAKWKEVVLQKVADAEAVLFFVSQSALDREEIADEIREAKDENRLIIPVILEDLGSKVGIRTLRRVAKDNQAIVKYGTSPDDFRRLLKDNLPAAVIGTGPAHAVATTSPTAPASVPAPALTSLPTSSNRLILRILVLHRQSGVGPWMPVSSGEEIPGDHTFHVLAMAETPCVLRMTVTSRAFDSDPWGSPVSFQVEFGGAGVRPGLWVSLPQRRQVLSESQARVRGWRFTFDAMAPGTPVVSNGADAPANVRLRQGLMPAASAALLDLEGDMPFQVLEGRNRITHSTEISFLR